MDGVSEYPVSGDGRAGRAGRPVVSGAQLRELFADDAWLDELSTRQRTAVSP